MKYDLEIPRIIEEIKKNKAKRVCLQLPDGLKPQATKLTDQIQKQTDTEVFIWGGSNFGACDIPTQLKDLKFDLVFNFGHSQWV